MKLVKTVIAVIGGFIIVMGAVGTFLLAGQSNLKNMPINAVDFQQLKDGVYTGQYQGGRWSNTVAVTVASGSVTNIRILKDVRFPKTEVTEDMVAKVIQAQSLDVDAVTGATITAKAYLKAIENALSTAH